jgi:hypothetical protein
MIDRWSLIDLLTTKTQRHKEELKNLCVLCVFVVLPNTVDL